MSINWKIIENFRWLPKENQFLREQLEKNPNDTSTDLAKKIMDNSFVEGRSYEAVLLRICWMRGEIKIKKLLSKLTEKILKINLVYLGLSCLLFILLIWMLNYFSSFPFLGWCKYLVMSKGGENATVLFGITSGILSLMGLLAIFVSITTQQHIEKCRETKWELEELGYRFGRNKLDFIKMGKEYFRLVSAYIRNIEPNDENTKKIIDISRISIVCIVVLWTVFISTYNFKSEKDIFFVTDRIMLFFTAVVGIIVLLSFNKILDGLKKVNNFIDLPSAEQISNATLGENSASIYFAATRISIEVKIQDEDLLRNRWGIILKTNNIVHDYYIEFIGFGFDSFSVANNCFDLIDKLNVVQFNKYKKIFKPIKVTKSSNEYRYPINFKFNKDVLNGKLPWDIEENILNYYSLDLKELPFKKCSFLFRIYSVDETQMDEKIKILSSVYCEFTVEILNSGGLLPMNFPKTLPNNYFEGNNPINWWSSYLFESEISPGLNPAFKRMEMEKYLLQ